MKNKEIEELLNELKEVTNSKKISSTYCITNKHWQLLLSYIEQLENNRDKAIEFGNGLLLGEATFEERHIASRFLNILKGGSDD